MAILQRTPPARRPAVGLDAEPATSSPSRSRLIRSSERQNESYVFPSLETMAAERQAAMALAPRNSPVLSIALKARSSVEASGGSIGSSSFTGRKILGGQVGRNGPVLSSTVAKTHPPIGSPRAVATQSSIPRKSISPLKPAVADRRSQSPAIALQTQANGTNARDSISPAITRHMKQEPAPTTTTERSEFEAQMERALASGADPFQDRKRDLMRGESRIPTLQHEHLIQHSPRRALAIEPEASASDIPGSPGKMSTPKASTPKASTPKAALPQSPLLRTKTHAVQLVGQSPASQSTREAVLKLKAQIEETKTQLEEAQAEAAEAQRALKEKDKLHRQQRDKIRMLERRLIDQSTSGVETESSQLRLIAFEWEFSREKCRNKMARGEEAMEREIEAIISRNEVTYMDARRAESELDLKAVRVEKSAVERMLRQTNEQHEALSKSLKDAEIEKHGLEDELEATQASKDELESALGPERKAREDLEVEIKALQERLAKEEAEPRRLKQKQPSSPVRKEVPVAARQRSSPAQRLGTSDMEKRSPSKVQSASSSKAERIVSETVRQSPRKKLSAFVRSTSAKIQSTVMRQSDGMSEDEQEIDEYEEAIVVRKPKAATKVKQAESKVKKKAPISEEAQEKSEEEVEKKAVVPKKKTGILSRAKITSEKSAPISSKRKSDGREDGARMLEMEREVQQTPMLPAKKKKGKAEIVRAANEDDSLEVEATPIIKPKAKQQQAAAAVKLVDDTTKTPVIRSKKRKDEVQGRPSEEGSSDVVKGTEEEPKKKRKRILKQSTNIATNFFNPNGDAEGALDPELNLPLQLSPCKKDQPSTTTGLGSRGAAASRIFGR